MEIDGENKKNTSPDDKIEQNSSKFGKVIKALHSKAKLPSLRTYQGDMAEFIKNKDESVVSIAIKEKEKKEKIETGEKKEVPKITPESNKKGFQINLTVVVLSLLLILGGSTASFYIFKALKTDPLNEVVLKQEIIPYNNSITLANITKTNFGSELAKLHPENGISVLKISDTDGSLFQESRNFFNFLEVSLPSTLERTLKDEYVVGVISQNEKTSPFVILTINDFGRAFSAMLNWEEKMEDDLSFLNLDEEITIVVNSTTTEVIIPMKQEEFFSWKDIIIKNKDTRALVNEKGKSKIAYTFLDKNTILITNNLSSIGEISSIYASRSIVR